MAMAMMTAADVEPPAPIAPAATDPPAPASSSPSVAPPASPPTAPSSTSTQAAAPVSERPLLLVLDVDGAHLTQGDRDGLTEAITLLFAKQLDLEVQSAHSLIDRATLSAEQQAAGCDSSACLAEIANAMGARFVTFTRVVRIGEQQILRCDIFDSHAGRTLALGSVQGQQVAELFAALPHLVDDLVVESGGGLPRRTTPRSLAVMPEEGAPAPLVTTGLTVAGSGLVVGAIGVTTVVLTSLRVSTLSNASDAYAADPTIDNARAVIDARAGVGPGSTASAVGLAGICGGCLGISGLVGGLIALVIGNSNNGDSNDDENGTEVTR